MKYFLIGFVLLTFLISTGCNDKRPRLLFNDQKITRDTVLNYTKYFEVGQKINYVVLNPRGFKNDILRVQVVKKDEKTNHWGYSIVYSKDVKVDKSQKFYIDYFVLSRKGLYMVQVFYLDNFDRAFARNDLVVSE